MRIITADETGLLKTTGLEAQRIVVAGSQSRKRAVRALCWAQGHKAYAAARQDGVVTVWEDGDKVPRLVREMKGAVGPDVVGMASIGAGAEERLVVAHESGGVKVLAPFGGDDGSDPSEEGEGDGWEVTGPLSCMTVAGMTLAAGGKERELGLWDAATGQAVWEARNVPHDKLDLRQPVWVTAASFLDGEEGGAARTVAVGTAYKQIRIYDARAQRRPVRQAEFADNYRITALCAGLERGAQLVLGDAAGTVLHLDAGSLRVMGRMEGPAGSVRGLARHPDLGGHPFVAVAGLDRMARVYDLRRPRKEAYRFYLKQRLTALLFAPEGRRGSKGRADVDAERRARLRAKGEVDEEELEGMEDDVGSFDGEGGSSSEEEREGGEGEAAEARGGGGERHHAVSYQRVYESGSDQQGEESDSEEEEDDEPVAPFGRRGDAAAAANMELNIAGLEAAEGDEGDSSEGGSEEEGDESDMDAEDGKEEESESSKEEEVPAAPAKRTRRR